MRIAVLVFFLVIAFSANSQMFSGEVHYQPRHVAKSPNLNLDSLLAKKPGTSMTYLITNGYYKSSYFRDGKLTYSYTYHDPEKRMYDEYGERDVITFRDSRKRNVTRIRSIIYKDSIKTIQGHKCFMVERIYENHVSKSYYAVDLKIDPESFQGHEVGDWYHQIKEVGGALSMGSVNEYADYVEFHEVVKLIPRSVKREEFDLPKAKLVVAAYDAVDTQAKLKQPANDVIMCYQSKLKKAPQTLKEDCVSYIGFVVSETGVISHIAPYEEDDLGLFKIGVDIISNCKLEFTPAQLGGKNISSYVYFPIKFAKQK